MKKHLFFILIFSQVSLAQEPKPFKTCNKIVNYTVDDLDLRKNVGLNLAFPHTNSYYTGGTEMLKKYFLSKTPKLTGTFRTLISFVVNCKGQVGNFEVVLKNEGVSPTFTNEILEIAKKMPPKWKAATSKEGNPVDSYQVLQFTIVGGRVRDINYK